MTTMFPATFTRAPCAALASCTTGLATLLLLLLGTSSCSGQLVDEAGIVANDYISHGYQAGVRSKRVMPVSSTPCSICVSTYSPDSCLRCWLSTNRDVPIYAGKRGALSSSSDNDLLDESLSSGLDKRVYRYQRQQRGGCACCYHSRFQNKHCCMLCQRTSRKRSSPPLAGQAPRANDVMSRLSLRSAGTVEEDDDEGYGSPAAHRMDPDCFCCARGGLQLCCSRCFSK